MKFEKNENAMNCRSREERYLLGLAAVYSGINLLTPSEERSKFQLDKAASYARR
jgi:hypothetical protein